jgi:nucleoid-associated protein YgaU
MKRMIRFAMLALLVILAAGTWAQNLADNEYLKKSLELKALSTEAFDAGDYDAAKAYALEARDWALRSDDYVAKALEAGKAAAERAAADKAAADARAAAEKALAEARASAERAIAAATARLDWATTVGAKSGFPKEFDSASRSLDDANKAFGGADYPEATRLAEACIAALANVTEFMPWPATYKVRSLARSDCLWRIAEYPFIYNDPLKWTVIYEANKKTFKDPSNPNLIFPGQVLSIPSVNGETRKGSFDPAKAYGTFPKIKK